MPSSLRLGEADPEPGVEGVANGPPRRRRRRRRPPGQRGADVPVAAICTLHDVPFLPDREAACSLRTAARSRARSCRPGGAPIPARPAAATGEQAFLWGVFGSKLGRLNAGIDLRPSHLDVRLPFGAKEDARLPDERRPDARLRGEGLDGLRRDRTPAAWGRQRHRLLRALDRLPIGEGARRPRRPFLPRLWDPPGRSHCLHADPSASTPTTRSTRSR